MTFRSDPSPRRRVTRRRVVLASETPDSTAIDEPTETIAPEPDPIDEAETVVPAPLLLADLRSPQFAEALQDMELVLIPIGAHEQHGPALPVSTDALSAQVLCGLAGTMLGRKVGIAPVVPWGVSWSHLGFSGTISLRHETLIALIEDIVTSLHRSGVRRFLLVNTHGGNNAALEVAAERCHVVHGVPVVASIYAYSLIATAAADELGPEAIGHAGGDESAVVMAIRPELVDIEALGARALNDRVRHVMQIMRSTGGVLPIAQVRTSESGASGDSTHASADAGSTILARAAGQLNAIAEAVIGLDPDEFMA